MKRNTESLDRYITDLFEKRGYPGMSISLRGPEGVILEKGLGYRNCEKKIPVDRDTVFGIASMSKSMTSLACAILHTEGKLSLDDPVVKYFPDFHIPGAPDECVTLKTIAMHRAGLPPMPPLEWSIAMNSIERESEWYSYMLETAPNKMDKIDQIIEYISEGSYRLLGAPGEIMSYSNEGYAILSYVVDMAAGKTLEEFLKERVFGPLGMTRTVLDYDCSQARRIAGGNITSLFERDDDGSLVWDDNWSVLPPFRGCACVKSTAGDMSRYYQMLSQKGVWEGKQVIPAEAVELMTGREFPLRDEPYYCLGLRKRKVHGREVCEHSGGLHGVSSFGGFMEGGYSAAVLCNEGDVDVEEFQWACYNFLCGQPLDKRIDWAEPDGREFSVPEALTGDFMTEEGLPSHCVVSCEDGRLTAVYGGRDVVLRYCGGTVFAAFSASNPDRRVSTFRFFLRDGKAWAVRCYNRVYQKI